MSVPPEKLPEEDEAIYAVSQNNPIPITGWVAEKPELAPHFEYLNRLNRKLEAVQEFVSVVSLVPRITLESLANQLTTAAGYGLIHHAKSQYFLAGRGRGQSVSFKPNQFGILRLDETITFTSYEAGARNEYYPHTRLVMEANDRGGIDQVTAERLATTSFSDKPREIVETIPFNMRDRATQMTYLSLLQAATLFDPNRDRSL